MAGWLGRPALIFGFQVFFASQACRIDSLNIYHSRRHHAGTPIRFNAKRLILGQPFPSFSSFGVIEVLNRRLRKWLAKGSHAMFPP
jgi:hypothetical protein